MKKIKISMLALVAVAFCACSSDDVALTESAVTPAIGGDGYMSLAINLPTQASTRAANDVYDDGLPSEYAVNDATLLLFAGDDESTATCYATYDLTAAFDLVSPADDNITSRAQVTQQIDTPEEGNLYALVILNGTGMSSYIGQYIGQTLSGLQTTSVTCGINAMTSNGFYMTNAPLINATGANAASGTVTTLAVIDPSKIYATEEKAAEDPAAEIYVERGMAKVTVDASNANTTVDLNGETIDVTIDAYALDLTNNVTYPVRNTTTASAEESGASWWALASGSSAASQTDLYRFAGTSLVDNNGLYRTYWAEDPNYNTYPYTGSDDTGDKSYGTTMNYLDLTFGSLGEDNPQYCLENTFSVAHQNQDETTRAIIQATFGDADFYIYNKNHSILYDWSGIEAIILNAFASNEAVEEALELYLDDETEFYSTYVTVSLAEEEATDDATVVITISDELEGDQFEGGEIPEVFGEGLQTVVDEINATHTIGYYEGGVSYYPVLIKHFGDDVTPWDEATVLTGDEGAYTPDTDNYNTSYPGGIWNTTADNNWLGRYGVLRNNWYDLNITAIAEPGYATPPSAVGTPDDPVELWISVSINILSWAKRTQDVTL